MLKRNNFFLKPAKRHAKIIVDRFIYYNYELVVMNGPMICTDSCDVGAGKLEHPISNEIYSEITNNYDNFDKQLRSIEGITNYHGVCGGGTQHLYILSKLLEGNDIRDIQLIDIDSRQLNNFIDITDIHNDSRWDREYESNLKKHCNDMWSPLYSCLKQNTERPKFSEDINVKLIHAPVEEHLKQNNTDGKYFIHLSNIPDNTNELDLIERKDNFEEGTIVLTVGPYAIGYTMYEKNGNDLKILFQG